MKFLLLIAGNMCTYAYNTGAWFPVVSVSEISDTKPFPINICYDDYVVWKSGESWSMVKDVCPHKLAPLSPGRINNNNIECPYHGQEFNGNGKCVRIPQLQSGKEPPKSNCVKAIKTHLFNDMLWGFFECKEKQKDSVLPEEYYPILKTLKDSLFIRDLPYSFDMAVENFLDPAHVSFAHDGIQGSREDGAPIPMSLKKSDSNSIEVSFKYPIANVKYDGSVKFTRPGYYHNKNDKGEIIIFLVPVKAGKCRVFIPSPKHVPKLDGHKFLNELLNSDLWIQNAEYELRIKKNKYILSTTSDISTSLFRKWYKTSGLQESEFFQLPDSLPEPLPTDKQYDPVNDHNKYCKTCSKHHKSHKRLKIQ